MAITKIRRDDKAKWLELRAKYIGGADAAAVCGLNEFQSPYNLWCEKCGIIPEFSGNLRTETGAYLEDFVAKKFEQETGKKVQRSNFTYFNSDFPWGCADIDRSIVNEEAILECKVVNELSLKHYANGDYPTRFFCQIQHYLAILNKKVGYLAVLIGTGKDFRWFTIERDDAEIAALMAAEKQFYGYMDTNTPPPIDGSESTKEAIQARRMMEQPEEEPEPIDLSDKRQMLDTLMELDAAIKQMEEQRDGIKNQIMAFMGDAWRGDCEGFKITYKPTTRKTFDWKKLQTAYPELDINPFFKANTSRSLSIKQIKEEQ